MKIGVISDTHIPVNQDTLPEVVFEYFRDVDMIIHAGDLVDISVLEELRVITPNILSVCGNMDSASAQAKLPKKRIVEICGFKIGVMHGEGAPSQVIDNLQKEFKKVDAVIFGHTHRAFNEVINGVLFFNPGSATDKIFAKENTIGILELTDQIKGKIIKI
ncbi:MAG: metallophosphoesterase family protein [Candidatus Omnitrophica bacterium]|nr:metallophosphoesterase family protein [Candidatus Omnitrophota bacterium]